MKQKQKNKIEELNKIWKCISRQFAHGIKTNIKEETIKLLKEKNIEIFEALYLASNKVCVGKKEKYRKTKYDIFLIINQCKQKKI